MQSAALRRLALCILFYIKCLVARGADKQVCVFCGLQKSFAIISNVCGRWLAREQGAVSYIPLVAVASRGLPKCESSVMPPRGNNFNAPLVFFFNIEKILFASYSLARI